MPDIEKYKGYQISVNTAGQFEASLAGEICLRSETMKLLKSAVDRAAKKAFEPFTAWVKKGYYYGRGGRDTLQYKKVTTSSISPLTRKVYWKDEKDETDQGNPDEVFLDTPENIKQMNEASRLDKEADKLRTLANAAEKKVKRIDVKKWISNE